MVLKSSPPMDSNVFSLADDTPQVWLEEEERGVGGGAKGAVPGGRCQEGGARRAVDRGGAGRGRMLPQFRKLTVETRGGSKSSRFGK